MQILIMNLIWRLLPKIFYTTIAMKIKKSSLIGFTHPPIVEPFLYYLECMSISIMNLIQRFLHKIFVTATAVKSLNLSAYHMKCPNAVIVDIDIILG